MPLYSWHDKENDYKIDVYKDTVEKYQEPPLEEELPEEERGKKRIWVKLLGVGIRVVKGSSWGGSKGNW